MKSIFGKAVAIALVGFVVAICLILSACLLIGAYKLLLLPWGWVV